jgi:hypothetical protein
LLYFVVVFLRFQTASKEVSVVGGDPMSSTASLLPHVDSNGCPPVTSSRDGRGRRVDNTWCSELDSYDQMRPRSAWSRDLKEGDRIAPDDVECPMATRAGRHALRHDTLWVGGTCIGTCAPLGRRGWLDQTDHYIGTALTCWVAIDLRCDATDAIPGTSPGGTRILVAPASQVYPHPG